MLHAWAGTVIDGCSVNCTLQCGLWSLPVFLKVLWILVWLLCEYCAVINAMHTEIDHFCITPIMSVTTLYSACQATCVSVTASLLVQVVVLCVSC